MLYWIKFRPISVDLSGFVFLSLGAFIGALSALSFLRTEWEGFHPDFFFWVSILTTFSSFIFLIASIWQYLHGKAEKEKSSAQVKIWMEEANGITASLKNIGVNAIAGTTVAHYTTVNDVGLAVYAASENARALYQSLYEERCVTEIEYRAQQKEIGKAMHEQRLNSIIASQNATIPLPPTQIR